MESLAERAPAELLSVLRQSTPDAQLADAVLVAGECIVGMDDDVIGACARLAGHRAPSVRTAVAHVMGARGGEVAMSTLSRMQRDSDPGVRRAAFINMMRM
jgi:HEAT repeat protein